MLDVLKHIANRSQLQRTFGILLIVIFTFPVVDPIYDIGLDSSYIWGFNWLFENNYYALTQLQYPLGPLFFLMTPTTEGINLEISLVFYTAIKILFLSLGFRMRSEFRGESKGLIADFAFLFIACSFINLNLLIVGSCLMLSLLFIKSGKIPTFLLSVILATLGLFIKISIGIIAFSMVGLTPLIVYFFKKNAAVLIQHYLIVAVTILAIGMVVFAGSLVSLLEFGEAVIKLSGGFSDSLNLNPNNNWFLIGPFLVIVFSIPVLFKDKYIQILTLLLAFPFFASWKHGMVREDQSHFMHLISFTIIFGCVFMLIAKTKRKKLFVLFSISIGLLYLNFPNVQQYQDSDSGWYKAHILNVLDFKSLKYNSKTLSEKKVSVKELSQATLNLIGENTIDFYPFEHSYAAANNLNWTPRRTVEIGASTSQWASEIAASHFELNLESPEFVLFHLMTDFYDGNFGSIDGRYILNDEPLVIYNLLNNYSIVEKNPEYLLFQKNANPNFKEVIVENLMHITFNQWIDVPTFSNEVVRLKMVTSNTFLGKVKEFLYKDEIYFVDYELEDGRQLTYRIVPSTARDGLWCNPFICSPETNNRETNVVKLRFRTTNAFFVKDELQIQFEHLIVKPNQLDPQADQLANGLFLKTKMKSEIVIVDDFIDFDSLAEFEANSYNVQNQYYVSGGQAAAIFAKGYSYSFRYNLDSLWAKAGSEFKKLRIQIKANAMNINSTSNFVISLTDSPNDFWNSNRIENNEVWNTLHQVKVLNRLDHLSGSLKVYVWNNADGIVYVDDFGVQIVAIKNE